MVGINIKDTIWKDNSGISNRKQETKYQSEVQVVILAKQKLKGCDILQPPQKEKEKKKLKQEHEKQSGFAHIYRKFISNLKGSFGESGMKS